MKTIYKNTFLVLCFVSTMAFSQQTVFIDFGPTSLTTAGNYNNMSEDVATAGSNGIADMINDTGALTGFTYAITQRFEFYNTVGATSPTGDAAIFDANATSDSHFTSAAWPNGIITLSGLDDAKYYSFEFFASRATTQNRETDFTITGSTTINGFLNPGGATADGNTSNTLLLNNVQPSGGAITVDIKNGPNNVSQWAYMNALKMEESSSPLAVEDYILENAGFSIYPNPASANEINIRYILKKSTEISISVYDMLGREVYKIDNGINQPGTYNHRWNRQDNTGGVTASGMYILELRTENGAISKKLILE